MTRVMYDALTWKAIPSGAEMVAGYIDAGPHPATPPWTDADFAHFPNAVLVRIATQAGTNDGHVLDVESGDVTPDQAPGWVQMRRRAGVDPSVYCSEAAWGDVRAAFASQGVPEPHYWIAGYPGSVGQNLYPGSVAHQWGSDPNDSYDISVVADYWPGVDPAPELPKEVDMALYMFAADGVSIWRMGDTRRHVTGSEWSAAQFLFRLVTGKDLTPFKFSQEWWDSVPVAGPASASSAFTVTSTVKPA